MEELVEQIRAFARERDWEQFHSPKNLAISLSIEAAEILEIFQWMDDAESYDLSENQRQALEEEIGDVMLYLTHLADKFGIDVLQAAKSKIRLNAQKYPADIVRGKSNKYTDY
jgi:dCTP diphosphatase